MNKCKKCGGTKFLTTCSTRVYLDLDKNGVLTAVDEEDQGDNGLYICDNCDAEYEAKDFKDILYR